MKTKQTRNRKNVIIITAAIITLVISGSAMAYQVSQNNDSSSEPSSPSSKTSKKASSTKDLTGDTDSPTAESNKSNTNSDPQATTSTDSSTGKTIVSVVSSVNVSDGVVYIRGGINNVVDTDGACYALLKGPSGNSIRKDTTLLPNSSTSDCKTIQIKTGELTSGTWTYTLNYSSNTEEGVSSEGTFNIQ